MQVEVEGGVKRDNLLFFFPLPFDRFSSSRRLSGFVEVWVESSAVVGQGVGKWRGRGRAKRGEASR